MLASDKLDHKAGARARLLLGIACYEQKKLDAAIEAFRSIDKRAGKSAREASQWLAYLEKAE